MVILYSNGTLDPRLRNDLLLCYNLSLFDQSVTSVVRVIAGSNVTTVACTVSVQIVNSVVNVDDITKQFLLL